MTHAVLFDVDETLLDTRAFIRGAFAHAFRVHGREALDDEALDPHLGHDLPHTYARIAPDLPANSLIAAHRVFQTENLHLAKPYAGAIFTLRTLREAGLKIAAVTTRSGQNLHTTVEQSGLGALFHTVVTGEDTIRHKPFPDPVLTALQRLGVAPSAAYMVGDSRFDIEAGKAAGTKTIAVSYGLHRDSILESHPDHLVHHIEGILPIVLGQAVVSSHS